VLGREIDDRRTGMGENATSATLEGDHIVTDERSTPPAQLNAQARLAGPGRRQDRHPLPSKVHCGRVEQLMPAQKTEADQDGIQEGPLPLCVGGAVGSAQDRVEVRAEAKCSGGGLKQPVAAPPRDERDARAVGEVGLPMGRSRCAGPNGAELPRFAHCEPHRGIKPTSRGAGPREGGVEPKGESERGEDRGHELWGIQRRTKLAPVWHQNGEHPAPGARHALALRDRGPRPDPQYVAPSRAR